MKIVTLAVLLVLGGCLSMSAQDNSLKEAKPAITKQAFQDRLAGLEKGRAQALADLSAYDGAIQECQYWLEQVEKAEAEAKAAPKEKPKDESKQPEPKEQKK